MLEYTFKSQTPQNTVNEIVCENVYFALDGTFISGVTSPKYGLVNGQTIYIKVMGSDDLKPYKSEIQNKQYRGTVTYNSQKYDILMFPEFNGQSTVIHKGIIFADGRKYISDDNKTLIIDSPQIVGDNIFNLDHDFLLINTKYDVINNCVNVGDMEYFVNFDDSRPHITLDDGKVLEVEGYNKLDGSPNIIEKTHFKINKCEDENLYVTHISPSRQFKTVTIDSTEYILDTIYGSVNINETEIKINDPIYRLTPTFLNKPILFGGDETFPSDKIHKSFTYDITADTTHIIYGKTPILINTVWRNTDYGDYLNLYLSNNSPFCSVGDTINALSVVSKFQTYVVDEKDESVVINGNKYFVSLDTLDYFVYWDGSITNPTKYELPIIYTNESKTRGYVMIGNTIVRLEINGLIAVKLYDNVRQETACERHNTFDINKYNYITIDNKQYIIHTQVTNVSSNGVISQRVVQVPNTLPITLLVVFASSNQVRCKVKSNLNRDSEYVYTLANNMSSFTFKLKHALFDEGVVGNTPTIDSSYAGVTYQFFYDAQNFNIPILFGNKEAINMHQDEVCENGLFSSVYNSKITPIIDMEKDIYYPAFMDYESQEATLIDEIEFDLHFRSRNMLDWTINNDEYGKNGFQPRNNWNILDAYSYTSFNADPTDSLKPKIDFNDFRFYQPSDLLYFLNFSNNDVVYQKSKLSKSFIRILFFDSPNPYTQSLLSSATVFMNEGELYMKYANNINTNTDYISVNEMDNSLKRIYANSIGVGNDTWDPSRGVVTCIENKRLASTIKIKNMFETLDSSEGFYLYLFREYSSGLHQRTIYMKIEFNHAGEGRTINFLQPFIQRDGKKDMLDFSSVIETSLLKQGFPLASLQDYMYIPINVKYDFRLKKYIYFLPEWLTMHNPQKETKMRFNLYETKIKNES